MNTIENLVNYIKRSVPGRKSHVIAKITIVYTYFDVSELYFNLSFGDKI